jgi:hypothetical protein
MATLQEMNAYGLSGTTSLHTSPWTWATKQK